MKSKRRDFSTLFGISASIFIIILTVSINSNILNFIDIPSIFIVVLCTLLITSACFSFHDIRQVASLISKTIILMPVNSKELVLEMLEISRHASKYGIVSLDKYKTPSRRNSVFAIGLELVMSGEKIHNLEAVLNHESELKKHQYKTAVSVLRKAAEIAPSMGLVGTLLGLIDMLSDLNDLRHIGPAMSMALLTTLYGAIMAYMVLFPLAGKFEKVSHIETRNMRIFFHTLTSIARSESPRNLEYTLNSLLPESEKLSIL